MQFPFPTKNNSRRKSLRAAPDHAQYLEIEWKRMRSAQRSARQDMFDAREDLSFSRSEVRAIVAAIRSVS